MFVCFEGAERYGTVRTLEDAALFGGEGNKKEGILALTLSL